MVSEAAWLLYLISALFLFENWVLDWWLWPPIRLDVVGLGYVCNVKQWVVQRHFVSRKSKYNKKKLVRKSNNSLFSEHVERLLAGLKVMLANSHVTWEGGCYIGGILLTTTEDTDRWWEEYFEVLLNPTETSSVMDVEPLDEGDDSPITGVRSLR